MPFDTCQFALDRLGDRPEHAVLSGGQHPDPRAETAWRLARRFPAEVR
ncbi:MAG: hypothetical protein WDA20_06990 [Desulfuromonadales bacterium]